MDVTAPTRKETCVTRRKAFGRRLLLSVDAKGYGSAFGGRQATMQQALVDMLDCAAEQVGLRRPEWDRQPSGDGELSLLPGADAENVLVDDFPQELEQSLADYNEDRLPAARLRLRLAVHHGVAFPGANGWAGEGVVTVSRLVDSPPARIAQVVAPEANLVVVLSNRVFLDTVARRYTRLRPEELREVRVKVKEYDDRAHLYLPGGDVHALDLTRAAETREAETDSGATAHGSRRPDQSQRSQHAAAITHHYQAEVVNTFSAPVIAEVIGKKVGHDG